MELMRVLFIAPHLSTGGMPAFLLKRVQAIQQYTDIEVFVAEWKCYSLDYTIQRKQIQELVGENFISFLGNAESQKGIVDYCYNKKIDIIHIEEIPEGFDSHNPFNVGLQQELYSNKHPWKVVETCHNIYFNPTENKQVNPDAYACVTPHHSQVTFKNQDAYISDIYFPIDTSIQYPSTRDEVLTKNGWLTKGEFHIVNIGLFTPGKNQKYAIEIAKELYKKYGYTYIFHFIGNQAPNFADYWKPLMSDLTPNIHIHGERDDTSMFFKMCDLMLFTSTWECNPIVLKEAISNNIKIMAYKLDHYGDEYTNYITPLTGNIDIDKQNIINTIFTEPKYNIESTNTSVENFANKHLELYQKLLNE